MERIRILSLKNISQRQAAVIRQGQMEAARAWTACRDLHLQARREGKPWPGRSEFHQATKGGRFALHSQTIQQVFRVFDAAVQAARETRRNGRAEIRYPYRDKRFFPLLWPAQAMGLEDTRIVLPMGRGRPSLVFRCPEWLLEKSACKVVWNGVHHELHITVSEAAAEQSTAAERRATVDLGQIHQAAVVTSTGEALVVSGRGMRSLKRLHSQQLGAIQKKRSRCQKGSRRWRKLGQARAKLTLRYLRRVRDLRHKGTRKVIEFCKAHGVETLFVGNPDGVRRNRCGRKHNQRMSQWAYGKDIEYLKQKSEQARIACFTGDERGTSSRCPECGHRHKPRGRDWRCPACGFRGHRDVVGAVNMHPPAFGQGVLFPTRLTYLRPGILRRSSRLDTGQSCPAESRNQALPRSDRRGSPPGTAHEPRVLARSSPASAG
ncbi:RNA-guided endonuclease InsQ/TnpB family protein [Candidatus Methylocalor cossyra]|uniref:Transposase n=1 Tax=Candidatus Methylocalor cossyra TaxID=3108543 RepID=A0ABM9NMY4_9GAMM